MLTVCSHFFTQGRFYGRFYSRFYGRFYGYTGID